MWLYTDSKRRLYKSMLEFLGSFAKSLNFDRTTVTTFTVSFNALSFLVKYSYTTFILHPWSLQEIYVGGMYRRDGMSSNAEMVGDKTKSNTGGLRTEQ